MLTAGGGTAKVMQSSNLINETVYRLDKIKTILEHESVDSIIDVIKTSARCSVQNNQHHRCRWRES